MPVLSSDTLFHFTPKLDYLENILENGLKYGMLAEKFPKGGRAYFIRGISFCNIPLSMISEHVDWYGPYAIGFKRSAIKAMGGSPVFYIHSMTKSFPSVKNIDSLLENPFLCYLKQYYGKQFFRKSGVYKNKKFYDEKEWRLFYGKPSLEYYISNKDLEKQREKKNSSIPMVKPLLVKPDMIEYIILEKPEDLKEFDLFLKDKFHRDREYLLTKILYYTQIRRDF